MNATVRRAVAAVILIELAFAWTASWLAVHVWTAPVRTHPDGAEALFAHGSRGVLDLARTRPELGVQALAVLAVALITYALASIALGGILPRIFVVPHEARLREIARALVAAVPSLVLLACFALLAAAVAALIGFLTLRALDPVFESWNDVRYADFARLACIVPALAVLFVTGLLHDLARAELFARPGGALAAARAARDRFANLRGPFALRALAFVAVSAALLACGLAIGWRADSAPTAFAWCAIALQQALACARFVVRARWWWEITGEYRAG